tara:strand:+ start:377 stop:700 length:324 start_codon:yes stop_codon:yes gene_type:complete
MNRLIDTMTDLEITNLVEYLADVNVRVVEAIDALEDLFKPVPHWSDNLDVSDSSTWVLCWVSDKSASSTSQAKWIYKVNSDGSYGALYHKYATPVDLNLRYNKGTSE